MTDNIIKAQFGKKKSKAQITHEYMSTVDKSFDKAMEIVKESETHEEGKSRCMALLASLSGKNPDREELRDKKNDAHFEAKDRL